MAAVKQLNVQGFLDTRPFGLFHGKIVLLGLTLLILDGFDVVAMGFIAPAIIEDWKVGHVALVPVLSMGLFGLAIGAAFFFGLVTMMFLLGYCTNSSTTGWSATAASYYPTEMRATGTSSMTGIGRFGAISGEHVGAILLSLNWSFGQLFMSFTIPIGTAIAVAYIGRRPRNTMLQNAVSH